MFNRKEYKAAFSKVTASQETYERILEMYKKKPERKTTGVISKILIAAVLVSLLAVTASAAESSWFTKFFGTRSELNQEQVLYLEEKTQKIEVEPTSAKNSKQDGHQDILQFVREMTVCSADQNNTHITGVGQPSYHDIKLDSLTLTEKEAKLYYYYYEDMDLSKPCSIENITIIMDSGEEIIMPITASTRIMTFTSEKAVDLEHVSYIRLPDGVILHPVNEVDDGYNVTLDSVMTDGSIAYFTISVTVPEYIPLLGEGWTLDESPSPHIQWICPADIEKPTTKQLVEQQSFTSRIDDGDNKETTYKLVTNISFIDNSINFTSGSQWKMSINGFGSSWSNAENQKKIDEKYAGQDYMLDVEEAASVSQYRDVCWDTWEFTFTFDGEESAIDTIEFVQEPILLSGTRLASIDELLAGIEDNIPVDANLVSFKVSPLSYTIEYTYEDGKNAGGFIPGGNEMYTLVMKDGTQYELFYAQNQHGFEEPIILANIDHLILPNGQKLSIPH